MLSPLSIPANARFWNSIALLMLALCAVYLLMGLVRPLMVLPTHALLGFGEREGWNAGHAARLLQGLPLYPPAHEALTNNYPPLSFLLMAGAGYLGADIIFAGRWINLAAFLCSGFLVFRIARRLGCGKTAALLGAFFLITTHARFFPYYIAINDPQWLAHALMLGGLYVLVSGKKQAHTVFAVLLMLAAGLTKHNLTAMPLAAFVWLFFYDRRRFLDAVIAALALSAAAAVALYTAFGDAFWHNMLNARVLTLAHFLRKLDHLLAVVVAFCVWISFTLKEKPARQGATPALIHFFILGGLFEFLLFAAGEGVAANITFDLVIALSLAMAFVAEHFFHDRDLKRRAAALTGLGLLFFLQLALWQETKFIKPVYDTQAREALRERGRKIEETVATLKKIRGNAWCQNASFCYWAGKPVLFDIFNTSQRIRSGMLTQDDVRKQFTRDKVQALQVDDRMLNQRPPKGTTETTLARLLSRLPRDINPPTALGAVFSRK